jgi:hypothetical protein
MTITPETAEPYQELYEQYKWLHAIISILIENEGGAVEISREVLENYNLSGSLQVTADEARDLYTIEVVPMEVTDGNA